MTNTLINYFDMYESKDGAWQNCQDIYWMLVMLDDSGYNNTVGCFYPLMRYVCETISCYSCYFSLESQTKFEHYLCRNFNKNTQYEIKLKGALIEYKYVFTKYKNQRFDANKSVELILDKEIKLSHKLGIAVRYGLKLGTDEAKLVKRLRELVPYPYLLSLETVVEQKWWLTPPKSRNIIDLAKNWHKSLLSIEHQERKNFFNFTAQCNSLEHAWNSCQKAEWLLALIDLHTNCADTPQIQNALRKFLCQLAREDGMFNSPEVDCNTQIAVELAEQFINDKASLKDLKVMEIELVESLKRCKDTCYDVMNKALRCIYQSAWVAVLEAVKYSNKSIEAVRLRELIDNPFV